MAALTAVYMIVALAFVGLAVDIGRAHLYKAMVQNAVDASALAGALQIIPMVEIAITRWYYDEYPCSDPDGNPIMCGHWVRTSPVVLQGPEAELLDGQEWWRRAQPKCQWPYRCRGTYEIVREWIIMPPTAVEIARAAFDINRTFPGADGATVEDVTIDANLEAMTIRTTATLSVRTYFLKLIGIETMRFTQSGAAAPVRRS